MNCLPFSYQLNIQVQNIDSFCKNEVQWEQLDDFQTRTSHESRGFIIRIRRTRKINLTRR